MHDQIHHNKINIPTAHFYLSSIFIFDPCRASNLLPRLYIDEESSTSRFESKNK